MAAAASRSTASGTCTSDSSGTATCSAKPPCQTNAATRSPSAYPEPGGALRTTPATSQPGTTGGGGLCW